MILICAAITIEAPRPGCSSKNLLGPNAPPDLLALLSNEEPVTKETPPTFLVHTMTDTSVPVENSLAFVAALRRAGVPFELHLYERGPHGFALGGKDPILTTWPYRLADWLRLLVFARFLRNANHGNGCHCFRPSLQADYQVRNLRSVLSQS